MDDERCENREAIRAGNRIWRTGTHPAASEMQRAALGAISQILSASADADDPQQASELARVAATCIDEDQVAVLVAAVWLVPRLRSPVQRPTLNTVDLDAVLTAVGVQRRLVELGIAPLYEAPEQWTTDHRRSLIAHHRAAAEGVDYTVSSKFPEVDTILLIGARPDKGKEIAAALKDLGDHAHHAAIMHRVFSGGAGAVSEGAL